MKYNIVCFMICFRQPIFNSFACTIDVCFFFRDFRKCVLLCCVTAPEIFWGRRPAHKQFAFKAALRPAPGARNCGHSPSVRQRPARPGPSTHQIRWVLSPEPATSGNQIWQANAYHFAVLHPKRSQNVAQTNKFQSKETR